MTEENDSPVLSLQDLKDREFFWAKEYATRNYGIGVICERCGKYRLAMEWSEEEDVPEYVDCSMIRIDGQKGSCSIPSNLTDDSDEFSEGQFVAGDVVLAKYHKYPWWPAIITDDVTQTDNHFVYEKKGKFYYHVEFFHTKRTTRALIQEKYIKPYNGEDYPLNSVKNHRKNLEGSIELAKKSLKVPKKVRTYWMLKYIKYRKDKRPITVDEIPVIKSIQSEHPKIYPMNGLNDEESSTEPIPASIHASTSSEISRDSAPDESSSEDEVSSVSQTNVSVELQKEVEHSDNEMLEVEDFSFDTTESELSSRGAEITILDKEPDQAMTNIFEEDSNISVSGSAGDSLCVGPEKVSSDEELSQITNEISMDGTVESLDRTSKNQFLEINIVLVPFERVERTTNTESFEMLDSELNEDLLKAYKYK